jgi:hypothetical protein
VDIVSALIQPETAGPAGRARVVLACDLGGTRLKIGLVQHGQVLAQVVEPANSRQGLAPQLPALKAAWLRLLSERKLNLRDCVGISIAFPSLVDPASGRVLAELREIRRRDATRSPGLGKERMPSSARHRERRPHGLDWRVAGGHGAGL